MVSQPHGTVSSWICLVLLSLRSALLSWSLLCSLLSCRSPPGLRRHADLRHQRSAGTPPHALASMCFPQRLVFLAKYWLHGGLCLGGGLTYPGESLNRLTVIIGSRWDTLQHVTTESDMTGRRGSRRAHHQQAQQQQQQRCPGRYVGLDERPD